MIKDFKVVCHATPPHCLTKRFLIHSSVFYQSWSPLLMSSTRQWRTRGRKREKKGRKRKATTFVASSSFFLFIIDDRGEKYIVSPKDVLFFSSLSLCRCLPLSTSPPLLFKDYRRLGVASTVESYTFYIIVVELWYPWMTRSSYLLDFQKYFLTIDYF